ncbi:hypothetical protein LJR290_007688 [Variovorax sp. LjRoot290]|uniref:hypothetical protein n=1 Tax=Variovorax sp. LjRoot290 TaxID=3342316 RepID=UPI003ECC8C35
MDEISTEEDLIQAAIASVERARVYIEGGRERVPSFSPTDLGALTPAAQDEALRVEAKAHRARPEWAAIQCCLTSSSQLLEVSRSLLQRPAPRALPEQMGDRKKLVNEVKVAGRTAYRAALILSGTD